MKKTLSLKKILLNSILIGIFFMILNVFIPISMDINIILGGLIGSALVLSEKE